jgi:hypothetical protein
MKPVYNGTARDPSFFPFQEGLRQVREIRILGTPNPRDYKKVPLKTGFHIVQVPFKTGLTVYNIVMWLYSYMRQPLMLFYVRLAMIVHN